MDLEKLLLAARKARETAYAPYSGFRVGAALLDENGNIHVGANVENAAYTGSHAEYGAVAAMIAGGGTRIAAIVIAADGKGTRVASPCGGCRQHLQEFSSSDTVVVMTNADGHTEHTTIEVLLPGAFGAANFEK